MKAPFDYSLTPGEGFKKSGEWGAVEVIVYGDTGIDVKIEGQLGQGSLFFSEMGARFLLTALTQALDFCKTTA